MHLQNITNLIRLISFTNDSEVSRFINNQNDFSKAYLGGGGWWNNDKFDKIQEHSTNGGLTPHLRPLALFCVHFIYRLATPLIGMGLFVPLENFSLIWKRHHCRRRAANCDLCSTTMAIEQWGIFDVPHLLWDEPTLYSGHVRGPGTLTFDCFAVGLSLPVLTTSANPEDKRYLYGTAAENNMMK